jgi:hypothetical protein
MYVDKRRVKVNELPSKEFKDGLRNYSKNRIGYCNDIFSTKADQEI